MGGASCHSQLIPGRGVCGTVGTSSRTIGWFEQAFVASGGDRGLILMESTSPVGRVFTVRRPAGGVTSHWLASRTITSYVFPFSANEAVKPSLSGSGFWSVIVRDVELLKPLHE